MEIQKIKISKIVHNTGQIEGLPANPRKRNDVLFDKLIKSIEEDPEMLELRELLVYPHGDKYVVIAGNMRLDAMKQLGFKDAPCKVIASETPVEKLKAYTIKDNASFGEWDVEQLVADWDVEQLEEWGVDFGDDAGVEVDEAEMGDSFTLPDGDKGPIGQMTLTLSNEQISKIDDAIRQAKELEEYKYIETFGNTNANGNAIYLIISQWAERKK